MNGLLHHLECALVRSEEEEELRQGLVFILGAPRSGSTLLYQVLIERFDFGFLSNLHGIFYGAPTMVERIAGSSRRPRTGDYSSLHGTTRGWNSPSEFGQFWYRFFRRNPQHVGLGDVDPKKMVYLRKIFARLTRISGRPMLVKNMVCSLRLAPLAATFPEAKFVVIRRAEIANAHSLLEARQKIMGSYRTWWSMQPANYPQLLEEPCHVQVVEQIRGVHRMIDEARAELGSERFTEVTYEDLCADPGRVVTQLERFFENTGVGVETRGHCPPSFSPGDGVRIDRDLYERMVRYASADV